MTSPASPIPNAARRPSVARSLQAEEPEGVVEPAGRRDDLHVPGARRLHPRRALLEVVRHPGDVVRRDDDALSREAAGALRPRARTRRRRGRSRRRARRRGARRPRPPSRRTAPLRPRERSVARRVRPRNASRRAGRSGVSSSASRRSSTAGIRRVDEARGLDQARVRRAAQRGDEKRPFCRETQNKTPSVVRGGLCGSLCLPRALGRLASDERVSLAVATRDASARGPRANVIERGFWREAREPVNPSAASGPPAACPRGGFRGTRSSSRIASEAAKSRRFRASCRAAIFASTSASREASSPAGRTPRTPSASREERAGGGGIRRRELARLERGVRLLHEAEEGAEGRRGVQVVLVARPHGGPRLRELRRERLRGAAARAAPARSPSRASSDSSRSTAEAAPCERVEGEVQLLPVGNREEEVADRARRVAAREDVGKRVEVPLRLRHLLAVDDRGARRGATS